MERTIKTAEKEVICQQIYMLKLKCGTMKYEKHDPKLSI